MMAARRRKAPGPAVRLWRRIDLDGVFAFALFAAMLFISDLGTLGAALFSLAALGYLAVRASQLGEILAPRVLLLLIPGFAIFSVFWSQAHVDTAKYALEFALTIGVGLLLSGPRGPRPCYGACSRLSRFTSRSR